MMTLQLAEMAEMAEMAEISHKDAARSHSLIQNAPVKEVATRMEPTRSQRTAERRIDYRALDRGENIIMNE